MDPYYRRCNLDAVEAVWALSYMMRIGLVIDTNDIE